MLKLLEYAKISDDYSATVIKNKSDDDSSLSKATSGVENLDELQDNY